MKGYHLEFRPYEPVTENTLVGCRRCYNSWYEPFLHTTDIRINGPMQIYDVCDKCRLPTDDLIGIPAGSEQKDKK